MDRDPARNKKKLNRKSINYGKMIGSTGLVSRFMIDEQIGQRLRAGQRADKTYSSITVLSTRNALIETFKAKEQPALDEASNESQSVIEVRSI